MKKSTATACVFLAILAVILGWIRLAKPFDSLNQNPITPSPSPTAMAGQPTAPPTPLITAHYSVQAKVTLVLAYPVIVKNVTVAATATISAQPQVIDLADIAWIRQNHPGVITLFGSQISTASAHQATAQLRAVYPTQHVLIAVDHEGGSTQRLSGVGFSKLPSWQTLCAQSASQSTTLIAESLHQVKQAGVDVVLAPVVDLTMPGSSLGSRTCASQPAEVVQNAKQFIQIAQTQGLWPVVKHFPGIGSVTKDLHTSFAQVTVTPDDAQIYQQLLTDFPSLGVMATHVGVTNQYPDVPCSLSASCVGELSSNYPQSLIVTDALDMVSAGHLAATASSSSSATTSATGSASLNSLPLPQRAVAAIKAGNQILFFGQAVTSAQMDQIYQALVNAYQQDPDFKIKLDVAAERVAQVQQVMATLPAGSVELKGL